MEFPQKLNGILIFVQGLDLAERGNLATSTRE